VADLDDGGVDAGAVTVFRKATRADAFTVARTQFLAGDRVEMQTLASQLGISRTTLYRWVGEREQLLAVIFSGLIPEWLAEIAPQARGEGFDWFVDALRRFLEFGADLDPLTEFTQREPALAMRVLTDREGPVTLETEKTIRDLLASLEPEVEVPDEIVRAIGLVARTLVWANIASGQAPDIDSPVELARTLLDTCLERAGSSAS
jgi:AcrR family transcriptional regulator